MALGLREIQKERNNHWEKTKNGNDGRHTRAGRKVSSKIENHYEIFSDVSTKIENFQ